MENFPPYFTDSNPTFWKKEVFTPQTFTVKVRDRNPLDKLYARWVSDYPDFEEAFSKLLLAEDKVAGGSDDVTFTYGQVPADCANFAPRQDPNHRLVVFVSDRPFLPPADSNPDRPYDSTKGDAVTITGGWNIICQ